MAADAVRSLLTCCQVVKVLEGPIGEPRAGGIATNWAEFSKNQRVHMAYGEWPTDAVKRTSMLRKTKLYPPPVWGVILDGDEQLLWGEGIPALIEHHEAEAAAKQEVSYAATLRIVEGDGTMGFITARVLRLDLIDEWLISSYHFRLKNGIEVSHGNAYPLKAGEPDSDKVDSVTGMQLRRPLQGEPHILHRSWFRPPQRTAERQSVAEGSEFERLVTAAGLEAARGEQPQDDRLGIWLPK